MGLNCALGATLMRLPSSWPRWRAVAVSYCPNAGLPNPMSETGFNETPDERVCWASSQPAFEHRFKGLLRYA